MNIQSVITGTGSFIPPVIKTNSDFTTQEFYVEDGTMITTASTEIIQKFEGITGIGERRYVSNTMNSSDMAAIAAREAVEDSGINREEIDQVIVAHNFGNVIQGTVQTDILPALASRVKFELGIKNPACVAYDIIFGCPGWLQGIIQADSFFKAGIARKALIVGTETLSRVVDIYDRDSMIFSDGAGAAVLEAGSSDKKTAPGILSWNVQSDCSDETYFLYFGKSNHPDSDKDVRYIKMKGRKVYEYAMQHVPLAMKGCLDKASVHISDVSKIFLHQANEKMDEGIVSRLFRLYGIKSVPAGVMPMNIHKFGNSSVATIPTLFDMVRKQKLDDHSVGSGDIVLFASVGAGMNINAVCYRV